jgi:hypothetical protein|tara:strand:- start:290 stop:478 length:189 start_codon:yes stop_codon:yes gene_type:complete
MVQTVEQVLLVVEEAEVALVDQEAHLLQVMTLEEQVEQELEQQFTLILLLVETHHHLNNRHL